MNDPYVSRRAGLLAERALQGLSSDGQRELATLGGAPSSGPDDYELAAAALHLALTSRPDPLPSGLRDRMERQAADWMDPNPE